MTQHQARQLQKSGHITHLPIGSWLRECMSKKQELTIVKQETLDAVAESNEYP